VPPTKPAGQELEACHHAGIAAAQQSHHGVADGELRLPDRQQHIDQVGQAIVDGMRAAGGPQGAAGQTLFGSRQRLRQGKAFCFGHDSFALGRKYRMLNKRHSNVIAYLNAPAIKRTNCDAPSGRLIKTAIFHAGIPARL
jgi:hypothetical protein